MFNITIDGHVGCGKSTLAKGLAQRLAFKVFDTGAVYRSLACAFKAKYGQVTEENIQKFVKEVNVRVVFLEDEQHVFINEIDYHKYIRLEEISMLTAKISPYLQIRSIVLQLQRDFAENNNCVMEGRDIGTVVLPNANVKFFITASEKVRAERRYAQIKDKQNAPTYQQILNDLRERDYSDEHRKAAPLKPAKDSIIIDTSNMTLDETIQTCLKHVKNNYKF